MAGKKSILSKAKDYDIDLSADLLKTKKILNTVKSLENNGHQFEGAEGSFVLLLKRTLGKGEPIFDSESFDIAVKKDLGKIITNAIVEIKIGEKIIRTTSEGDGPVNALDRALRKALEPIYPKLKPIKLTDYKVRVLNAKEGTAAKVRVLIECSDGKRTWSTVGVSTNIIEASWNAMLDALEYGLMRREKDITPA